MLNEGVLLRQDMTSVWKIEVADGVIVVLGIAVGEGAGGNRCIVNSGQVDVATGGMSTGMSCYKWVRRVVALSCVEFLVDAWKTKMISGVIELMVSLGWNPMRWGYSI